MPTLSWIGKDKVVTHHNDVSFRLLDRKYTFGDTPDSGNKIIHGDNLEALKALLPEYENNIKCIYIDPPYNTGNEGWVYNDNVNDPHIRRWLGKVVGSEVDDLTRHDKWLCMMYPRLSLLQKLLADDGVIFISIDDNEQANLKLICDEIFGVNNFVGIFTWIRKKKGSFLSKTLRKMTEYIFCYKGESANVSLYGENAYSDKWQPIVKRTNSIKELAFPANIIETTLNDGDYSSGSRGRNGTGINFLSDFSVLEGRVITPLKCTGKFVWTQNFLNQEISLGTRISLSSQFGFNVLRHDQAEKVKTPSTLISSENGVGTNEDASENLQSIFGNGVNETFPYSKPYTLISYLLRMRTNDDKNAIILDSFAGSGTTAHAVLNLNKQDGGNRKFILVEMMDYAEDITAERVRRVMKGYGTGNNKVEGTGGSFDYYELGETIFDPATGYLNDDADTEQIRSYVWFSETNTSYTITTDHPYLLGSYKGCDYYFYYAKGEETCLDWSFLNTIKHKAEIYIIYADRCLLTEEEMTKFNIRFKKIPRDIKRV